MAVDRADPTFTRPALRRGFALLTGFRRPLRWVLGLGLAAVLVAACTEGGGNRFATGLYRMAGSQRAPSMEVREHTVEFAVVPASRAMIHAPDAVLVLQRNLGSALEQRIVLANPTAMRGDNIIHIRAQTDASARLSEFNFEEITTRFGGLPAPFQRLTDGALLSGEDDLGSYVYARETIGTNTLCVLVLRRLTVGARPLPEGAQALDLMMRNCVQGSLEEALEPLSARALSVSGSAGEAVYSLSPHAAPRG
ncbi:MAG: hypothetical protein HLUCCA12_04020 [Rhodobacteraceae bacterium HLUCCA12]|nr:MAG: hypothetical protein HLUCCA12_04020 [Rhodobacteraceae bacterium HLUCCA12]